MDLKVSVIIPTHNRAGYLVEAIASIRRQSLAPFEIIVVDDGSTDRTAEVVAHLGAAVRYVWQEQTGVAGARNRGLAESKGDVIAWLDSDDLWEPDFLQTVMAGFDDAAVDGVYTGLCFIDEMGDLLPSKCLPKIVPPEDLYRTLLHDNFIPTPSMVVRKACYEAAGPFDPELHICEDTDMWLRLAGRCRLIGIPRPLVRIRVHGGNTMANAARFSYYRLRYICKRFGPLDELVDGESGDSRLAYAYAYRSCAYSYLQAGEEDIAWQYLTSAGKLLPAIWTDVDLYYELLCGQQGRGQRGDVLALDVPSRLANVRQRINQLDAASAGLAPAQRRLAFSNLYLAGTMINDTAGAWRPALAYLLRAMGWNPGLLKSRLILRRLIKLALGHRAADLLRDRLRGGQARQQPALQSDPNANSISVESIPTP